MTMTDARREPSPSEVEHVDVLIVGAGISGIGAAHHLIEQCPEKRFVILEAKGEIGGTWATHRYPGTRSDSDLYTFGYRFKPWTSAPIATRQEILTYLGEVIDEDRLTDAIRFQAWAGRADREETGDPHLPRRGDRRGPTPRPHPLPPPHPGGIVTTLFR